jgi:hypothetical protein
MCALIFAAAASAAAQERPFFGVRLGEGARIDHIFPGGPAEKAGLQVGDVVTASGERQFADTAEVQAFLAMHKPGDVIELSVKREADELKIKAELARHTVRWYLNSTDPPRVPGGTMRLSGGTLDTDYRTSGNTVIDAPSTVTRSFTQEWTGVLDFAVTKAAGPPLMTVGGPVKLAGMLHVRAKEIELKMGTRIELITVAKIEGQFDELLLPPLPARLAWQVNYDDLARDKDLDGDGRADVTLVVIDARMPPVEKK